MAGAGSMALGEWVSVTSSRELAEREIRIEASELREDPEGEGEELKLIYEAKGLSPTEAETMARRLLSDRSTAIDALAREELGIDPRALGGSAWEAAVSSFVLFALGAVVPILPFLVLRGTQAVVWSAVLSALYSTLYLLSFCCSFQTVSRICVYGALAVGAFSILSTHAAASFGVRAVNSSLI